MSLADEWINKTWHSHTMEYYSTTQINEVQMCATTWENPRIMLTEKDTKSHIEYDFAYVKKSSICP